MSKSYATIRRLGYARVSTYGQTLDAQREQLAADGCTEIFEEKASGARADRRELQQLLKRIRKGDVVIVTRIDRLARSTFDLFAIVNRSLTPAADSDHSRSHGPTPAPAPAASCLPCSGDWLM